MEKLLVFLVICVFAKAMEIREHTKVVRPFEEYERAAHVGPFPRLPCSTEIDEERDALSNEAQCGPPRKIFLDLSRLPRAAHEMIHPSGIWVNACIGLCDKHGTDHKCKPGKTIMRHIPVKLVDIFRKTERCAATTIEEPLLCTCCQDSKAEYCAAKGKVLVPRKCACNCPNPEEKRECLDKNRQWDRNNCTCEAETSNVQYSPTTAEVLRRKRAGVWEPQI